MALSRRQFVQTVGIGAGAALTTSVWGRGREHSIWSAIEPDLEAVGSGVISREREVVRQDGWAGVELTTGVMLQV